MGQPVVKAERHPFTDDFGLAEVLQRRVDADAAAANTARGGERRQPFECFNELGTTVRVSRVIQGIYADKNVAGAQRLRPGERQRQKHGIAGRNVGGRDSSRVEGTILGNRRVSGQGRPAKRRQVNVELKVPIDAERGGDGARRRKFVGVTLAVAQGQREQAKPFSTGDRRGCVGVEPAAEKNDGVCQSLDPPGRRIPDVLVELNLDSRRKPIRKRPFRELPQIHDAVDR